ncbi:MAG: hypothetical protein IKA51_04200 [Clostridia bacterium]|nr:hypothetical protein [Clostridia bacterium]
MAKKNFLGMDYGAGSGRGMLGSFDGKKLELREVNRFLNSPVPNEYEGLSWDIDKLYGAMKESLYTLKKEGVAIESVGIDTWAQDFGVIGKDGKLVCNPYSYRTPFFSEGLAEINKKFTALDIFEKTGSALSPVTTLSQLLVQRNRRPDYVKDGTILFMADLLGYLLTGTKCCDCSVPSMTLMYDNSKSDWSDEIINAFGLDKSILPPMVKHYTKCGNISDPELVEAGFGNVPLVSVAHHDTVSAFSAVDALGLGNDTVYISCGTWTVMGIPVESAVLSKEAYDFGLCNEMGLNGKLFLAKNLTGMWIEQECQRYWKAKGIALDYKHLDSYVANESVDDIVIDTQLPIFSTVGNMPEKIQQYCKETGQRVPETVEDIFAAIMHNMSRDYANVIKRMMEFTPVKAKRIQIVGGGAKNIPLAKFISRETGLPVYAGPIEATVTGNILAQMVASGEISKISDAKEILLNSFEIKEIK